MIASRSSPSVFHFVTFVAFCSNLPAASADGECHPHYIISESLSGNVFVGCVQPTISRENPVGFTHPTNVTRAFWAVSQATEIAGRLGDYA